MVSYELRWQIKSIPNKRCMTEVPKQKVYALFPFCYMVYNKRNEHLVDA